MLKNLQIGGDEVRFDKETFAENIRAIRRRMELSQEEFGRLIGCSQDTISGYENGTGGVPRTDNLIAICEILGVSPNDLLGWDQE